jgi:hypothetical protein
MLIGSRAALFLQASKLRVRFVHGQDGLLLGGGILKSLREREQGLRDFDHDRSAICLDGRDGHAHPAGAPDFLSPGRKLGMRTRPGGLQKGFRLSLAVRFRQQHAVLPTADLGAPLHR